MLSYQVLATKLRTINKKKNMRFAIAVNLIVVRKSVTPSLIVVLHRFYFIRNNTVFMIIVVMISIFC